MQRLTKRLKEDKGSERHLLSHMRFISDVVAGIRDENNPLRPTLIECLAQIQFENEIIPVREAERWIVEIKDHIHLLEKDLKKAREEIKMIRRQRRLSE